MVETVTYGGDYGLNLFDQDAAARLRRTLDQFPRAPVAHLPTPLDDCPRLSEALGGPRILMKRDDMTGLALGGSKARQFTYSLGPAVRDGYNYLVHGSDSQSNQSCQTAAAAARLGMNAVIVISRDQRSYPVQGNLLLDHLMGARVHYVYPTTLEDEKRKVLEALKAEGHKPYDTSRDGAILRAVAYVDGVLELCDQLNQRGIAPRAVYTSSWLYTIVGLSVGLRAIRSSMRAVGISYRVDGDEAMRARLAPVANECAVLLRLDATFTPGDFDVYNEYARPDFGEASRTSLEALRLVAGTEGILLDPIYTSKAMDGLIQHIRQGRYNRDDTIVFLHTGGQPALFAFGDELFG